MSFAQDAFITGKILDFEKKESIPYVTIGVLKKAIGTISNSDGDFKLRLKHGKFNVDDSVTFSCIGYKTQKHKISSLLNKENVIELNEEIISLEEIVVSNKKPKKKKIGRKVKGLGFMHWNFYNYYDQDVDDRLSRELGMQFNLRKDCEITGLNFNITTNQFKSVKFRLNFYKVENKKPTELLFKKDIVFEVKEGFLGWYKVDLKKYHLYVDKDVEDVAITIQWLESEKKNEKSKYFAVSASASPTSRVFFREQAMDKWVVKKSRISFYVDALYY
jgi:hypothetical protein